MTTEPGSSNEPHPASAALHTDTTGKGPGLVMAHGFTQTGRVWASMDTDLAADHRLVLVDMPGHGGSAEVAAGLDDGAALLGEAGGRASYLGYSMGARFCLHLAVQRPDLVDDLVLISGTAGIDDEDERRQRREADGRLAEELDPVDDRSRQPMPVESFVRRWLQNPMFDGISASANALPERLRNTGPGLASSLRLAGTGSQHPLWGSIVSLTMPVLIVTGELDQKFTALGRRMAEVIGPTARHVVVTGAGHAPHLQRPGEVAELVRTRRRMVGH
jgi:2-succinyl-6-hydroxy-2,4-cyclohexadiene-1-carboxylate synthase